MVREFNTAGGPIDEPYFNNKKRSFQKGHSISETSHSASTEYSKFTNVTLVKLKRRSSQKSISTATHSAAATRRGTAAKKRTLSTVSNRPVDNSLVSIRQTSSRIEGARIRYANPFQTKNSNFLSCPRRDGDNLPSCSGRDCPRRLREAGKITTPNKVHPSLASEEALRVSHISTAGPRQHDWNDCV